eukprot:TRINITY_DN32798_c0_g1_i1.p1 TRINITY_DN32798_c0_g1~~TRINITY_DN32798_c0_g1_i1.p1  ORF type:complete len:175 (+),score=25.47 TRINITY_DN32798_c0_g1_i1:101-625(+)
MLRSLVGSEMGIRDRVSTQSTGASTMGRNYTIGIVQSNTQDLALQSQVNSAVGNDGCWSGAYAASSGGDFIWSTGTGASDTCSNGVKISNGGTSYATKISSTALLNYVPGTAPFGARWNTILSDIGIGTITYGCTVCVVSACNVDDNDHNVKGLVIDSKTVSYTHLTLPTKRIV